MKQSRFHVPSFWYAVTGGLALGLSATGCRQSSPGDTGRDALKNEVTTAKKQLQAVGSLVMQGGTLSGQDEQGRPLWSLEAKEIRVQGQGVEAQPARASLTTAHATLYREGKAETTFQAAQIEFFNTPKVVRMVMTGGVRATTQGAKTGKRGPVALQAPQAEVNIKTHRLHAAQVTMNQGAVQVTGQELLADTALAIAQLRNHVKATSPDGAVTADAAVWQWKTGRAQAMGKVVATHQDMTLTGSRLDADTNIKRGDLTGEVRAQGPQGRATAGALHYDWASGAVVARGGVKLTKDNGSLEAARVETDAKFDRATARGAVVMRQGDMTIHAGTVTTAGKMSHVAAGGGVTLARPDLHVTAATVDATDIDTKNHTIGHLLAAGDVHLVRGPLDVTAQHVDATRLNAQTKKVERMVATGGVRAHNRDGSVRAARVTWSGGQVVGEDGVTLTRDANVFTGSRLQSDDAFQQAKLSGAVHGHLAQGVEVTGSEVLWRRLQHHIVATGNVTARREGMRLRADRMDATEDGANATLTGNVVVTTATGATLRAPAMRYDRNAGRAGKVYASEGVWFHDPQKKIEGRGQTLVYDIQSREAIITRGSGSTDIQMFKGGKLF